MKTIILILSLGICFFTKAQSGLDLKDLAVPNSPGFKLLDISPTLVESPTTPKEFSLGILQAFQNNSGNWPQNYSMEFVPYWWGSRKNRDFYSFKGFKTTGQPGSKVMTGENIFSGLQFTSFSVAFANNDMIPDTDTFNQKIFSIGANTTFIKIHNRNYSGRIETKMKDWQTQVNFELDSLDKVLAPLKPEQIMPIRLAFINNQKKRSSKVAEEIGTYLEMKPIFSWNIAAAYATYGIKDSVWKTGRVGIWSTMTSNIPLGKVQSELEPNNYLALNFYTRFMLDNYAKTKGLPIKTNSFDIGGKVAFEFEKLSIGAEGVHRVFSKGSVASQDRFVGVINYKIGNILFLHGTFGKDFNNTNKLISLLGIGWGIGKEKVANPEL